MFFAQGFWFPDGASTNTGDHDWLFHFILAISAIFFALIIAVGTAFVLKYRRRPGVSAEKSPTHNGTLEIVWSVIPSILIVFIFYYGFTTYLASRTMPPEAFEVQVTAKKWSWEFNYPNSAQDPDLYVPAGKAIRLVMTSEDVIHSLSIPAFRLKQDVVPGRYTDSWFQCDEPGTYNLFCTEYCGTLHSKMLAKVHVLPQAEFDDWVEKAADIVGNAPSLLAAGEILYHKRGCAQCHSITGETLTGPSFLGSFGTERAISGGGRVTMDENYVRESLVNPQAKVVAGFQPVMPTFKGMKDDEITAIITYLKSLAKGE